VAAPGRGGPASGLVFEHLQQQRLLRVQPVLGLIEDH
jgi:hypothetical protein